MRQLGKRIHAGKSVLAAGATRGFTYIASIANTPSGVPTSESGAIPIVADVTNSKLWAYIDGAWRDLQGPAGPSGDPGADGESVVWRGAWVTSTGYAVLDSVSQSGSSYICKLAHTSGASTQPGVGGSWATYWDLMASKGEAGADGSDGSAGADGSPGAAGASIIWEGAWVTATGYSVLDAVANDGSSYICKSAHTSGASTEPGVGASWTTYWDVLAAKGDTGAGGSGDLPVGTVVAFIDTLGGTANTNTFGAGWVMCNGSGTISGGVWNGKTPPDMTDRFLKMTDGVDSTGFTSGSETHTHGLCVLGPCQFDQTTGTEMLYLHPTLGATTGSAGNLPPYYEVEFWLKVA